MTQSGLLTPTPPYVGIQSTGRWSFTPDPGAMITVPDQDWMAYGAWLTTPDVLDNGRPQGRRVLQRHGPLHAR